MKTHFSNINHPACGHNNNRRRSPLTVDPSKVTCTNCRKNMKLCRDLDAGTVTPDEARAQIAEFLQSFIDRREAQEDIVDHPHLDAIRDLDLKILRAELASLRAS